ncbi:quinoprotein dehydrogenase-associated putative ABC transporter substrate-binding protein [Thermus oshimai]|uniref:quinoprotein dehydrogenase-associated putative ABC transporter substrate-binding protein n=1 Tax=Thermus oshimai TaxID=56957 RepID=UPI00036E19E5|nr:quinoprotein dehydrogenase-associated putative ABC transporter substrate-binding protein [Thermus oshimai]
MSRFPVLILLGLLVLGSLGSPAQEWELRVCAEPQNLPYSNQKQEGFENRIAKILAEDLGAQLEYTWLPPSHTLSRDVQLLQQGACDLFMEVYEGQEPFLTTLAYYRSTFVFVYREDSPLQLESLDDPALRRLRIGVQSAASPPELALAIRGLIGNLRHYYPDFNRPDPLAAPVEAVARGEVDVAILWGPTAGFFAKKQPVPLKIVPVQPEIELNPFISMVYSVAIGLRADDEALRDELNRVLVRRWDEIQAVLQEYGVPLLPLPRPAWELEGR